jgi:septal ring factor EnvC (AmiA/AmiB activator)
MSEQTERELARLREENRRLTLALTEETARVGNLRASLDAVRDALGDAAGQTGTLAEDVAALVSVVESVRGMSGTVPDDAALVEEATARAHERKDQFPTHVGQFVAAYVEGAKRVGRKEG